jgi:hypothetical protein
LNQRFGLIPGRNIVRFDGYWVSADASNLEVCIGDFDDTDLSVQSDWKEAWQNEDPEYAHGFLDPLTMLQDISKRIIGEMSPADLQDAAAKFRDGIPLQVGDLQGLARLIQLLIPNELPKHPDHPKLPIMADDESDDLPF